MGDVYLPSAIEPVDWILVFRPWSDSWLVNLLVPGRFKHVSACAYLEALRGWVTYDVGFDGTKIVVMPAGTEAETILSKWFEGCTLVRVRKDHAIRCRLAVFGWCAPSVARLIGLRSGALRPQALYRQCLRNGGTVLWAAKQAQPRPVRAVAH